MQANEVTESQYHKLLDAREIALQLRGDKRVGSICNSVAVSLGNLLNDIDDMRIDADLVPPF